jgi:hypothetical protein
VSLSTGLFAVVIQHLVNHYRKQGILVMGKAKNQQDLLYLIKDPHINKTLLPTLIREDKGFKEFQRMLGQKQILSNENIVYKARVIDLSLYFEANGIVLSNPSDGKAVSSLQPRLNLQGEVQNQYSFGFRIIDHEKILTSKGNMNFNTGEFNNLCKFYNIDPLECNVLLPLDTVKVSNGIELVGGVSDVYDITKELRFVSYKTDRVQSYARLSTVGCMTHGEYSAVLCHIINNKTMADNITNLLSRTIEGKLDSFVNLIKAGSGNDMLGSALFAAFPIYSEDKWHLIRNTECVNNLYMQVTSAHTKHVRKVRVKGAFNRRASHNLDIEKLNVGNETGAYIIDIRKGVCYIPQKLWTDLGLGDFDGDDCVIYPVNINKDKGIKIYLVGRNPMSGNTLFIGIQKGKGSVQDVPEWALPLVKFHKKITIPQAPTSIKPEPSKNIGEAIQNYIDTLFTASINSSMLGIVTNIIYKIRLYQIIFKKYPSAQIIVNDAHTLEHKVVKAIKTTMSVELTPNKLDRIARVKFGSPITKEYLKQLKFAADVVDQYITNKLQCIFPNIKLEGVPEQLWKLCSKYNYQCSYKQYMEDIVNIASQYSYKYKDQLPICSSTKGYNPEEWITEDNTDVLLAREVCSFILGDSKHYKLPLVDNRQVDKVNDLYTIFTSFKNPSNEICDSVVESITSMSEYSKAQSLKGDDLVKYKVNCGLSILRLFMNVKHAKLDAILDGYRRGAVIHMGVRDINDMNLRSFAYACIHAYIKAYIVHLFPNEHARTSALFQTGKKLFGLYNGKVRSNRLFWLYLSTFNKDMIMLLSNLWMDAQERKLKLSTSTIQRPVNADDLATVINNGINQQETISSITDPDDIIAAFSSSYFNDLSDEDIYELDDFDGDFDDLL